MSGGSRKGGRKPTGQPGAKSGGGSRAKPIVAPGVQPRLEFGAKPNGESFARPDGPSTGEAGEPARRAPRKPRTTARSKANQRRPRGLLGELQSRVRAWRAAVRRWHPARIALGAFLLIAFGAGFYIAQLYGQISALIDQRSAALTSAIYSAPLTLEAGADVVKAHLLERLNNLSYTAVGDPTEPGEYSVAPQRITIYMRGFDIGAREFPAELVYVSLDRTRIAGVADSFGMALGGAALEPEVIGRLLPGAPAERVEERLGDLKPYLVRGLLATEDRFFYYHPGFDPIRIIEAAIADLRSHHLQQGASTITQQLARTFIDRHERSFARKFRELAVALVIQIRLSKDETLERYINDVAMGEYDGTPIDGMPLAARYFFNKDLREVSPAEAATLIGMIQAPSLYDPRRHPENCRARRDIVLAVMHRAGVLDDAAYAEALATPLVIIPPPGLRRAPYFTDYVTSLVRSIPGLGANEAGLKVYTTLNPETQADAQRTVVDNLARLEREHPALRRANPADRLEGSLVALDARTGAIVALVGGRDYAASQFNRVVQAERQPGSAFKPVVYLTALDPARSPLGQRVTLASMLPDRPMSFGGWTPVNYERTYQGTVTVAQALIESLNVPTAYLGSLLGTPAIIRTAHELGIGEEIPNVLPISIGSAETTLLELASVYQVFASAGIAIPPYAIDAVYDGSNHLIYEHRPISERITSPAAAYLITGALQGVLQWGTGAGAAAMGLDFPAAGKTGTTEDFHDAYFVGYTPRVVTGAWVGFDHPQSLGLPGAEAALPAWVRFMTEITPADSPRFEIPRGVTLATIDPASGGLATTACPRAVTLPFIRGTAPTEICPLHGGGLFSRPALVAGGVPGAMTRGASALASAAAAKPGGAPTPASNSMFGAIGKFFGAIFHH